jgi:hypothetical protein
MNVLVNFIRFGLRFEGPGAELFNEGNAARAQRELMLHLADTFESFEKAQRGVVLQVKRLAGGQYSERHVRRALALLTDAGVLVRRRRGRVGSPRGEELAATAFSQELLALAKDWEKERRAIAAPWARDMRREAGLSTDQPRPRVFVISSKPPCKPSIHAGLSTPPMPSCHGGMTPWHTLTEAVNTVISENTPPPPAGPGAVASPLSLLGWPSFLPPPPPAPQGRGGGVCSTGHSAPLHTKTRDQEKLSITLSDSCNQSNGERLPLIVDPEVISQAEQLARWLSQASPSGGVGFKLVKVMGDGSTAGARPFFPSTLEKSARLGILTLDWERFYKGHAAAVFKARRAGAVGENLYCFLLDRASVVMIDDLKAPSPLLPVAAVVIETSRGNFQHLYCCSRALVNEERLALQRLLARQLGGDPGATSSSQPWRWPGSVNFKPGRGLFRARVVHMSPLETGSLDVDKLLCEAQASSTGSANVVPLRALKPARVVPVSSAGRDDSDSGEDMRMALKMLARGNTEQAVFEHLVSSASARNKHNPRQYAELTIAKAGLYLSQRRAR